MDSTVVAVAAEGFVFDLVEPASRKRTRRRPRSRRVSHARAWYREERAAYAVLQEARDSGDSQLAQDAQRAHTAAWQRAPIRARSARRPR